MMKAAGLSENLVNFYHTERRDIPGDSNLHIHRQVIFQSRLTNCCVAAARFQDDDTFFSVFICFKLYFRKHTDDAKGKANSIHYLHRL
jgi:hypothetical protein